jgi:hypothetical protein
MLVDNNDRDVAGAHAPKSTGRSLHAGPRGHGNIDQQHVFGLPLRVKRETFIGDKRCADDAEPGRGSGEQPPRAAGASLLNDRRNGVAKSRWREPGSGATSGIDDPCEHGPVRFRS